MTSTGTGRLPASPEAWVANTLPALFLDEFHQPPPGPHRWATVAEVLDDDAGLLAVVCQRLVSDGAPPNAAAHYVLGWYAGLLARTVGFCLATTGAGLFLDPSRTRYEIPEDGCPIAAIPTGCNVVVPAGHPWSGLAGTQPLADQDAVAVATIDALQSTLQPLVATAHRWARGKVSALWNEVADAFGSAVAHQRRFTVEPVMVKRLETALRVSASPWRSYPRLSWVTSARVGVIHVVQRGGCCLAFTEQQKAELDTSATAEGATGVTEATEPPTALKVAVAAYRHRFPDEPDAKRYCSTCCFRAPDDVDARQLFWAESLPR